MADVQDKTKSVVTNWKLCVNRQLYIFCFAEILQQREWDDTYCVSQSLPSVTMHLLHCHIDSSVLSPSFTDKELVIFKMQEKNFFWLPCVLSYMAWGVTHSWQWGRKRRANCCQLNLAICETLSSSFSSSVLFFFFLLKPW